MISGDNQAAPAPCHTCAGISLLSNRSSAGERERAQKGGVTWQLQDFTDSTGVMNSGKGKALGHCSTFLRQHST